LDNSTNSPTDLVTEQFPIEVGWGIRSAVRREFWDTATWYGLEINIEEDRGRLRSTYYITIKGSREKVDNYLEAAARWMQKINSH
jgi:hypothetical protein